MTKVSVLIGYNIDRGHLQEAIDSVNAQVFDGEIELIIHQSENNIAFNLNRCIEKSTGEYLKYVSEDDLLPNNSIQDSVNAIQGVDIIHGMAINFFENGHEEIYEPAIKIPTLENLLASSYIHGGSLFYRRELFDLYGFFDESLTCCEEMEYNLRLLKAGVKFGYCPKVLYRYRRHSAQKSLGSHVDQVARKVKIDAVRDRYR